VTGTPIATARPTWRDLGPGLLLAATGIGAGDMVGSAIAGAEYGLMLVWALAAGVLVKLAITEGAARWQLATNTTLVEGWRDHLPDAFVVAFFVYFCAWSYFVSSALVAASALVPAALVPGVGMPVWGILHALAALAMVWVGRYEGLLNVMKVFIGMMFAAVLATVLLILFRTGADWSTMGSSEPLSVPYTLSLIGGVGGTVTLLSYGYWMREQGWSGPERIRFARYDLAASFLIVFCFALSMIFLSTQIQWAGAILDEGPQLALLLGDRIGAEIGPVGRGIFLAGFWGAAFSSVVGVWHGVPFLFDDWLHLWRRQTPTGQRGGAYRSWAVVLTGAATSAMFLGRPVWLVFAYTVVSSLFFPFVIATLLWMNNSRHMPQAWRSSLLVNGVLGASLLLYVYLAILSL
jgi:Mn2+/Fe2+ NRAMP family transporter